MTNGRRTDVDKNQFLVKLSASPRTQFGKVSFADQTEVQKVFSAVYGMEGEVNNGGFSQYFASSDGESANYAPEALRQIGALQCASIVTRALATASKQPLPETNGARIELIRSLGEESRSSLEELDSEFFNYPDQLTDLLFEFVRKHPEAFGGVDE